MRVDFLPWVYSNELSHMSDRMDPFPVTEAIAIVERSTAKPPRRLSPVFDPEPINLQFSGVHLPGNIA